jgi:hypothetical protein
MFIHSLYASDSSPNRGVKRFYSTYFRVVAKKAIPYASLYSLAAAAATFSFTSSTVVDTCSSI